MRTFQTEGVENLYGEVWKPIFDGDSRYWISNHGRVKTEFLNRKGQPVAHELSPFVTEQGYLSVSVGRIRIAMGLRDTGPMLIHRLVAQAFLPRLQGQDEVNHKNGNKQDPRVSNLEWMTRTQNQRHAVAILKIKHPSWKLSIDQVVEAKAAMARGISAFRIARRLKVMHTTIWLIKKGTTWLHVREPTQDEIDAVDISQYAMKRRGRAPGGKLLFTFEQVRQMREEYASSTTSMGELSRRYDVSLALISNIVKRKAYAFVA